MNTFGFDVGQMAQMLNMKKNIGDPATVLFLGSRTSSLFRYPFLADQLKEFSNRDILNMTPIERFHECYKILGDFKKQRQDYDIHSIIRTALQETEVEPADICIAELMKQEMFDLIITTNIGSELEQAFRQKDMREGRNFEVVIHGSSEPIAEQAEKHTFKIIKASGDVDSTKYSICGYNIDGGESYLEKYPKLKAELEQVREKNMLIVGFDYEWDKHVIHTVFPRTGGYLWYINEEHIREDSSLSFYLQHCKAERIEGITSGYGPFFEGLCEHLGITHQITPDQPNEMEKILHEMRNVHSVLQTNVNLFTERIDELLQNQEFMMKDIGGLSAKVDTLLREKGK